MDMTILPYIRQGLDDAKTWLTSDQPFPKKIREFIPPVGASYFALGIILKTLSIHVSVQEFVRFGAMSLVIISAVDLIAKAALDLRVPLPLNERASNLGSRLLRVYMSVVVYGLARNNKLFVHEPDPEHTWLWLTAFGISLLGAEAWLRFA